MIAYFDCFSGISGDMTLGACIDLGVPVAWLQENLSSMPLTGFALSVQEVKRNGIGAKSVDVSITSNPASRNYADIASMINNSTLPDSVKQTSLKIFECIADAEAHIHKCEKEHVHFHEVGAIDSIVDIVGTALCVEYLGISKVVASHIPCGKGFVQCEHGTLPVPAPATLAILKDVPVYGTAVEQELVTPTGAAIVSTLAETYGSIPEMVIDQVGYGAGKNNNPHLPNLLRIILGKIREISTDAIVIVETCIDDMNPEVFGYLMDRLFDDGALDVYWIPVFMKKNRPGTMIQVVCNTHKKDEIITRILTETSTLGVRYYDARRQILERETIEVESSYGLIPVKRVHEIDGHVRLVPEYEVCRKIALEKNIPIKVVYDRILRDCTDT